MSCDRDLLSAGRSEPDQRREGSFTGQGAVHQFSGKVNEKGEVVEVDELNWSGIKKLAKLSEGEFVE